MILTPEVMEKYKDNPHVLNMFQLHDVIKPEMKKYFIKKKVPVKQENGASLHMKMICENNIYAIIMHMFTLNFFNSSDNKEVFFEIEEFKKGTQYGIGSSTIYSCDTCGGQLDYKLSSDCIEILHKPDESCYDNKDYVLNFEVPDDGIMVINDWLGDVLSEPSTFISSNSAKGLYEKAKDAESKGFIHFFVSNSSPKIYSVDEDTIVIGSSRLYGTEDTDYEEIDKQKYPNVKCLGYVCTDLWWVTMSSKKHCEELKSTGKKFRGGDEIKLLPGKWECIVHPKSTVDMIDTDIFATFKRVQP